MKSKPIPILKPDILLAKSSMPGMPDWKGSCHFVGHTAAVVQSVTILVDTLQDFLIPQFGLSCSFEELRATARLAAYLHDWGKANSHFQMVVRNDLKSLEPQYRRNPMEHPQMIRHEVASALLAWDFREWLQLCPNADFMTALAAAGGHHLKLGGKQGKDTSEFGDFRDGSGETDIYWYIAHPYFRRLIRYGIRTLGLPPLQVSGLKSRWDIQMVKDKRSNMLEVFADWKADEALLAVVKALLIPGDSIGSASAQSKENLQEWMVKELEQRLTIADLQNVIDARRGTNELRQFQIDLGNSPKRVTLARAGCGTGKTLGAYNWAKTYAVGRKLFFCYPTTGTSTEGFLDYVQDEVESVLLHSRAAVDLEMATTGEEGDNGEELVIDDETGKLITIHTNEMGQKLDSFKSWGPKVSVCTVDTVLGLLQCNRRPLYCFPAIAQAAFVFDEVHCYDDALFGALLRFLKLVKAPVLLMSASFLPWQIQAIEEAVGEQVEIIQGPKELEEQPRYRFHQVEKPDWERVEQEMADGGKVLWVCNQVNVAIAVYQEAKRRGLNAVLYHSRFRYEDRVEHHRAVVNGFKPGGPPILAIATQVAEMSLDLSATLLVTQIADPAGLIQRLGRLNRKYCGHALDAILYPPESRYPYEAEDLKQGQRLIQAHSGEVNQAELAAWLEQSSEQGKPKTKMVLLDGKWRTYPAALREAGYTVTALLEADKDNWSKAKTSDLARYAVPLTAKKTTHWARHKKGYPIAPEKEWGYSADSGAYEVNGGKKL
ncbi:MAG: CRISPR-associated helicase Cas3' [Alkalinema sp. RU_4_3]|nr:CRISPR-associated helicase Cas3' [Alkalinema sp. RU_4_3]